YADLVRRLRPGLHYSTDEEARNVQLTAAGAQEVERVLGVDLYAPENLRTLTAVNVALHAEVLLPRDVDYIVRAGAVKLISESRGCSAGRTACRARSRRRRRWRPRPAARSSTRSPSRSWSGATRSGAA